MESLLWAFRTSDSFALAWPILLSLAACFALGQTDLLLLLGARLIRLARGRGDGFRPNAAPRPTGLVIIPSLLRNGEDLEAFRTTVESCGNNGYPSELVIIASVDGITEQPKLVAELKAWVAAQRYPENVHVYVAGTPTRLGKMMAVEAGVAYMHELVAAGKHAAFPEIYFSIDGDGTLSRDALERLAVRLATPHPLTGNLRRVVSGNICIRPDLFWQGWRKFFSVQGQLYIQVAREFTVSNLARFNWKTTPQIGIPGALYCTWSKIIIEAPHFMGFMKSIRFVDLVKWWLGAAPPMYSAGKHPSVPEALTGASDDTCIAFIASIAHWKNGELSFDAPRTPLQAIGRFLRAMFIERSHDYEPEARVYTYTPTTLKGLWKQRVRWNASRFECAGRFQRAFWFHWEIGMPVSLHLWLVIHTVLSMSFYYVLLPYYFFKQGNALNAYVIGYVCQTIAYTLYTLIGLALDRERKDFWRVLLCLPLAAPYTIAINFFGCVTGVTKDLLLFGNTTNFAPEWTMAKGGCVRVALAFRVRRFFALAVRSALYGDVPLGLFWFGWTETPWTPNGFEGWTTGKAQRAIVPMPSFRTALSALRTHFAQAPAPVVAPVASAVVAAIPLAPPLPRLSVVPTLVKSAATPIASTSVIDIRPRLSVVSKLPIIQTEETLPPPSMPRAA